MDRARGALPDGNRHASHHATPDALPI